MPGSHSAGSSISNPNAAASSAGEISGTATHAFFGPKGTDIVAYLKFAMQRDLAEQRQPLHVHFVFLPSAGTLHKL
jgi:hypothetical protein